MDFSSLDTLKIVALDIQCIIGTLPHERIEPQKILIDITLKGDFSGACQNDDLAGSVDYAELTEEILQKVSASEFLLIERLAQMVADICLSREKVQLVRVKLSKPGAIEQCQCVQVEITRTKPGEI